MSLIDFLHDHRWWVFFICVPVIIFYGRTLVIAALGGAQEGTKPLTRPPTIPLRKMPPKPGSQTNIIKGGALPPAPPEGRQEVLPGSLGAGVNSHQKAGAAKTVKLPVATPKPTDAPSPPQPTTKPATDLPTDTTVADEMAGLFGKRDEKPVEKTTAEKPTDSIAPLESPTSTLRRKASRLQELGFHHSIKSDGTEDNSKTGTKNPSSDTTTVSVATPANSIAGAPESPRSSTAELTSILERIDKFLAEDTPSKPAASVTEPVAATTSAKTTDNAVAKTEIVSKSESTAPDKVEKKAPPMWARPDVTDDDLKNDAARKSSDLDTRSDSEDSSADEKKPGDGQQRLF